MNLELSVLLSTNPNPDPDLEEILKDLRLHHHSEDTVSRHLHVKSSQAPSSDTFKSTLSKCLQNVQRRQYTRSQNGQSSV
jgi:hypothetical protein